MNQEKIDDLNSIVKNHRQFIRSQAWTDITVVMKCDYEEAKKLVSTHCNMLSLFAICRASGQYHKMYRDFFRHALGEKFCDEHGYISDKAALLKSLDIQSDLTVYSEYEDILNPGARLNPDKFYQMKIHADTHGFHFMAAYTNGINIYLSDTSYRGFGELSSKYINKSNFIWIKEIV